MAEGTAQLAPKFIPPSLDRLPSQVFSDDSSLSAAGGEQVDDELTRSPRSSSSFEEETAFAPHPRRRPSLDSSHPSRPASVSSPSSPPASPENVTQETMKEIMAKRTHRRQRSSPMAVKESQHGQLTEASLDGPDSAEMGPRRLNEYTLSGALGKGAFGSVQVAKHDDGREFAVKEYSKSRLRRRARNSVGSRTGRRASRGRASLDGLEFVKTEIAILKKCSHPSICSLIEVIDTDTDSLFYILELCRGGPVLTVSVGQPVEPLGLDDARNVMQQVVLGLEYLHCNEIIHRDIKPDNILFVEAENDQINQGRRHVKIVDFGTSELFSRPGDDTTHTSAGSPAFMSPECCINADGAHGKTADIWSCGATLFALVTGVLPWEETQPLALSAAICNDPVCIPKDLPESLKDLINGMLTKSPIDRIEMPSLREHPWLTDSGRLNLPSTSENVLPFDAPSEEEIASAIRFRSTATVLKAVSRFKRRSISDAGLATFTGLNLRHSVRRSTPASPRIDEEPQPSA